MLSGKGCGMAGEQNVETAKAAYAAFSAGDAQGAMANIADDVEWITPGNSAISARRGKQEVGALWGSLAEQNFRTSPEYWFSDEDRVVVLTHITLGGEEADSADVLTEDRGMLDFPAHSEGSGHRNKRHGDLWPDTTS